MIRALLPLVLVAGLVSVPAEADQSTGRVRCLEGAERAGRFMIARLAQLDARERTDARARVVDQPADPFSVVAAMERNERLRASGISSLNEATVPWATPRAATYTNSNGVAVLSVVYPISPGQVDERATLQRELHWLAARKAACEHADGGARLRSGPRG